MLELNQRNNKALGLCVLDGPQASFGILDLEDDLETSRIDEEYGQFDTNHDGFNYEIESDNAVFNHDEHTSPETCITKQSLKRKNDEKEEVNDASGVKQARQFHNFEDVAGSSNFCFRSALEKRAKNKIPNLPLYEAIKIEEARLMARIGGKLEPCSVVNLQQEIMMNYEMETEKEENRDNAFEYGFGDDNETGPNPLSPIFDTTSFGFNSV